jgi:hypothetical protein
MRRREHGSRRVSSPRGSGRGVGLSLGLPIRQVWSPTVAGQESSQQERRSPGERGCEPQPTAYEGTSNGGASLSLADEERKVLALADLQAGESESANLLSGKEFVVRHTQAGRQVALRIAKPFKSLIHQGSSLHR